MMIKWIPNIALIYLMLFMKIHVEICSSERISNMMCMLDFILYHFSSNLSLLNFLSYL